MDKPQVWVDFNEAFKDDAGRMCVITLPVDGVQLTDEVWAHDGDGVLASARVCGVLNYGRGDLIMLELGEFRG